MLKDLNKNQSSGKLELTKSNAPVIKVINFIKGNLQKFPKDVEGKGIENENGLTQELCDLLNDEANGELFWFHCENMENPSSGSSARIDLAAKTREKIILRTKTISKRKAYFKIEAKRLPTIGYKREKEYVKGDSKMNGGIERFKKGIHSPDLPYGGIIAYVQNEDFSFWHPKVNEWIEELFDETDFWNNDDKLKSISVSPILAEYRSKNKRINSSTSEIILYHFWVKMN